MINKWKVDWAGHYCALVTPFTDKGELDEIALAQLVDLVIEEGLDGVVVSGHQGEFWLLSPEERRRVFDVAVKAARGRAVVIAGTTDASARQVIAHTRSAQEVGADGVMVLPPLHAKPGTVTDRDLVAHFERISSEGGMPVLVYNIPNWSDGINLTNLLPRLADIKNIVAVKQSSDRLDDLSQALHTVGDRLRVFSGLVAFRCVAAAAMGAVGVVGSAEVNVMGKEAVKLWRLSAAGNLEEARRIQSRAYTLVKGLQNFSLVGNSVASVKSAMRLCGRPGGYTRDPFLLPTPEQEQHIRKLLETLGLLPELPGVDG